MRHASRPTEAEFDELKRKRDEEIERVLQETCERQGWDRSKIHAHVSGAGACYCACPDGPCQHIWDGPDHVEDCLVSTTCSRCGMLAMSHDMRCMP